MGPKYEFTSETKDFKGRIVRRIRRLSDGKLGGWIEKDANLSQEGNCWVDDNAMVTDDACVYGNAKVFDEAWVSDNARVYGNAQVFGNAHVWWNAKVYDNAQVDCGAYVCGNAQVYGNANVSEDASVSEDAVVSGRAQVYGKAEVYGNAKVYGNAQVCYEAYIYGNAKVYDYAFVDEYAKVYGDAKVYGHAQVSDDAYVYGYAEVRGSAKVGYGDDISSGTVGEATADEPANENTEVLKNFVYKIDDSSKLDVQTKYDSADAFFEDDSDDSYVEHECLTIVAVDTKVPLVKLEKTQVKDQNVFKFIVEITTEDGAEYCVKDVIDTKEKFNKLLNATINSLREYEQFSKYADDIENCL